VTHDHEAQAPVDAEAKPPNLVDPCCFLPSALRFREVMWRTRLMTVLLILVWLITPDLLCLIPGVEMTADEHQCCEKMGADCGKIPMPDMHSCCRTSSPSQAVIVARTTDYAGQRVQLLPAVIPTINLLSDSPGLGLWQGFESPTSPPLIPRDSFYILRI
jgi:hypothetical protein